MLTVRPYKFEWSDDLPRYWFDGSPFKTHFMNSLSISFPEGEKYFIQSVNHFKGKISDTEQLEELNKFIAQETWHTYNHKKYNEWLERQGYPIQELQLQSIANIKKAKDNLGPLGRLVNTMVIEYVTAISGDWVLAHDEVTGRMHPQFAEFWKWHATEEVEHRSVVHKLLCTVIEKRGIAKKKMDSFPKKALIVSTYDLFSFTICNTIKMLKRDGQLYKWRTFKDAMNLLFNRKNGLLFGMFWPLMKFMITPFEKLKP